MSLNTLRLPATALGLMLLGLAACSHKSTETADFTPNPAGMYGTIAPAARAEDTQVEAKDVKVEEPAPDAKDKAPNKDVDAALTGSGAAGGHSSQSSAGGHSSQSSNRSSQGNSRSSQGNAH